MWYGTIYDIPVWCSVGYAICGIRCGLVWCCVLQHDMGQIRMSLESLWSCVRKWQVARIDAHMQTNYRTFVRNFIKIQHDDTQAQITLLYSQSLWEFEI